MYALNILRGALVCLRLHLTYIWDHYKRLNIYILDFTSEPCFTDSVLGLIFAWKPFLNFKIFYYLED